MSGAAKKRAACDRVPHGAQVPGAPGPRRDTEGHRGTPRPPRRETEGLCGVVRFRRRAVSRNVETYEFDSENVIRGIRI